MEGNDYIQPLFKDENITLYNNDWFDILEYLIINKIKIDHIICEPPYLKTNLEWDKQKRNM